mgnify:CR=1 FL=1
MICIISQPKLHIRAFNEETMSNNSVIAIL